MDTKMKQIIAEKIKDFRLPEYREIPNVGLYLDQVTKYINNFLAPLGSIEITTSMVSNYVKKGVIDSPEKKLYYAEQIAYLFFISIAKNVLTIENINKLIVRQKTIYGAETAYTYFCMELQNVLTYICGLKDELDQIGSMKNSEVKMILRSVIISASHIIFLNSCFDLLDNKE